MRVLRLLSLEMENFKGIKKLVISFGENTNISGENGTGKTTVFDAFLWLLFGKDSQNKSDFEIKTLDKNNKVIHKLEHSVTGTFEGFKLQRILTEKWTKKRGSLEAELTGNETQYFFNDIPCSEKDYKQRLSEIIDENLFKILSNPFYFANLKPEQRREIVINLAGGYVSDEEIANTNNEFVALLNKISGKTMADYKLQINSLKKKAKDELEEIPARIDEVSKSIPIEPDYAAIGLEIDVKEKRIAEINEQLKSHSATLNLRLQAEKEIQNKIFVLNSANQKIEFEIKSKSQAEKAKLAAKQSTLKAQNEQLLRSINETITNIDSANTKISEIDTVLLALRKQFTELQNSQFIIDDSKLQKVCPTCQQLLPENSLESQVSTLQTNFNNEKVKGLSEINKKGVATNELKNSYLSAIKKYDLSLKELQSKQTNLLNEIEALSKVCISDIDIEAELNKNAQYVANDKEIYTLKLSLSKPSEPTTENNNPELNAELKTLQSEILKLKQELFVKDQVNAANVRISELESRMKQLSILISEYEKDEFVIQNFAKAKMDLIETKVNSMFTLVRFKMFEVLMNGGEVPICDILINGVPYNSLNHASRVNAGLDIINTLSNFHQVKCPVWLDFAESVNNPFVTGSQMIRLIVTKDKTLKIE